MINEVKLLNLSNGTITKLNAPRWMDQGRISLTMHNIEVDTQDTGLYKLFRSNNVENGC
jgi:hypothetical protein